jgi:hypothetical protein
VFETIYSQVLTGFLALVVIFALLKGDDTERIGGAALALIMMAGIATWDGSTLGLPRWAAMALDIVLLGVFLGLIWQSRKAWPAWAAAFQSIIVTVHFLLAVNLRPSGDAFAIVSNMSNYGLLIALAVGTFWAWQERRAAGLK